MRSLQRVSQRALGAMLLVGLPATAWGEIPNIDWDAGNPTIGVHNNGPVQRDWNWSCDDPSDQFPLEQRCQVLDVTGGSPGITLTDADCGTANSDPTAVNYVYDIAAGDLLDGHRYYYQAYCRDDTNASRWSAWWFYYDIGLPTVSIDDTPPAVSGGDVSFDFTCDDASFGYDWFNSNYVPTCRLFCELVNTDTGVTVSVQACQDFVVTGNTETASHAYNNLPTGNYEFRVYGRDGANNESTVATHTWEVDNTAPDTLILTGPDGPTTDPDATFTFNCSDDHLPCTFECTVTDSTGGVVSTGACTSGDTFTMPADGTYTIVVLATDAVGNADTNPNATTISTRTWTLDRGEPVSAIDTGCAASASNEASPSFSFSCDDSPLDSLPCTYTCQVVGPGNATVFQGACTASQTFDLNAGDGVYTINVIATDSAGNSDATPATCSYELDSSGPNTSITSAPPAADSDLTPTFDFECDEPPCTYACSIADSNGATFFTGACDPGDTFNLPGPGDYTFSVTATDDSGNTDPSPATHDWTVDTTAPDTAISCPTFATGSPVTVDFSCTDAPCTFACVLAYTTGGSTLFSGPCASGDSFDLSAGEGDYSLTVTATDAAGNTDGSSAVCPFDYDATAPTPTIDSGPDTVSNDPNPEFELSCDEPGCTFECTVTDEDGNVVFDDVCTDPQSIPLPPGGGDYTFDVTATDPAGNNDPTNDATWTWSFDDTPPTVGLGTACSELLVVDGNVTLQFSCDDSPDNSLPCTYACTISEVGGGNPQTAPCEPGVPIQLAAGGEFTITVVATDSAGNSSDPAAAGASCDVTYDTSHPTATVDSGPPALHNSDEATFDLSCDEATCSYLCEILDDTGAVVVSQACDSGDTLTVPDDGDYTLQVTATDGAGNSDPDPTDPDSSTWDWTVDTTLPVTTVTAGCASGGIDSNPAPAFDFSCSDASTPCTFNCTVTHVDTSTVVFDGACQSGVALDLGASPPDGAYALQVVATDAAGNVEVPTGTAASCEWTLDSGPPDTEITSGPESITSSTEAPFQFQCDSPPCTFECTLTDGDGNVVSGPEACDSGNVWTVPGDGSYTFVVLATDAAGNADTDPNGSTWSWVVDGTPPDAPVIQSPSDGEEVSNCPLTVSGTAEPGATVEVYIDGESVGTVEADAGGNWSLVVGDELDAACEPPDGEITITATATDGAGNTSDEASVDVTWTLDSDLDGIPDILETGGDDSTDPNNPDTDGDGLCDGPKTVSGECIAGEDKNANGQVDEGETDPLKADTDEGGVPDGEEVNRGSDPLDPLDDDCVSLVDCDGDGLINDKEEEYGTDPNIADSDGDGLLDGEEVNVHETDPANADSDGDGLNDKVEVDGPTDPNNPDSDTDGLSDGDEVNTWNTDPMNPDTDGGGVFDGAEVTAEPQTDPTVMEDDFPYTLGGGGIVGCESKGGNGPTQGLMWLLALGMVVVVMRRRSL